MSGTVLYSFIELRVGEDGNHPSVRPFLAMQRNRRREKLAKEKKRFTDSLPWRPTPLWALFSLGHQGTAGLGCHTDLGSAAGFWHLLKGDFREAIPFSKL